MQVPKPVKEELGGGMKEFALDEVNMLAMFLHKITLTSISLFRVAPRFFLGSIFSLAFMCSF